MKVERGTNGKDERDVEAIFVARSPDLLFRRAKADPEDVRSGRIDPSHKRRVFIRRHRPERWRLRPDDLHSWVAADERRRQSFGYARPPPEEVVTEAHGASLVAERQHHVRTADALRIARASPSCNPNQWHAVHRNHSGGVEDRTKLLGIVCLY
jgi:hypothetical protein